MSLPNATNIFSGEYPRLMQPGGELIEERRDYSPDESADRVAATLAELDAQVCLC